MKHTQRGIHYSLAAMLTMTMLLASCTSTAEKGAGSQHISPPVEQTHSPGTQTGTTAPSTADTATDTPGPYAAEIKAAADKAYSPFAKDVLTDGIITRQEYLEAINRYKSCMKDHDMTVVLDDNNGYYQIGTVSQSRDEIDDDAELACEKGTIFYIAGLYERTVTDPDNQGHQPKIFECLKRAGLTPDGYTVQQYLDALKRSEVTVRYSNGVAQNTPGDVTPNFPFDMNDPRYGACVNNPQNPVLPTNTS